MFAVRKISFADLNNALVEGRQDFRRKPNVLWHSIIYPIIGLFLATLTFDHGMLQPLFLLAAGYALFWPGRRHRVLRDQPQAGAGLDPSWWSVFSLLRSKSPGSILLSGCAFDGDLFAWIETDETIYNAVFGDAPATSLSGFAHHVFETEEGKRLMIVFVKFKRLPYELGSKKSAFSGFSDRKPRKFGSGFGESCIR